ncbi:hypothetical protein ACUOA5_47055, partial [Escherichia coli]
MSYSKIAKQIGCHETNILKELKKRGLWEGYSREQIKENAKKKWDALCEEAVHLHNQGMSYYRIAKYLHPTFHVHFHKIPLPFYSPTHSFSSV